MRTPHNLPPRTKEEKLTEFDMFFNFIDKETGDIVSMRGFSDRPYGLKDIREWFFFSFLLRLRCCPM